MTYQTAPLLVDPAGRPMPQWYDAAADVWRPVSSATPPPSSGSAPSSGSVFTDQAVIVTTGTAVALPAHAMTSGVIVKSLSSNSAFRQTTSTSATLSNAVAGASGTTAGYILEPGEAAPYSAAANLTNTNQIYVNGQAGDVFSIIGS